MENSEKIETRIHPEQVSRKTWEKPTLEKLDKKRTSGGVFYTTFEAGPNKTGS